MGAQGIESGRGQMYWTMWVVWWVIWGGVCWRIWDIDGCEVEAASMSASVSAFVEF